jgi:hypothetical protein
VKESFTMAGLKYEKYVTRNVVNENKWGGQGISLGAVPETIIPPAARMKLGITVVKEPYIFHEPTHKHIFTEYFFFLGSNPGNMNEFDADIEYSFGAEHEKHVITTPTIVVAAPGVYHCPLNYARIGKPVYCLEAFMTSEYGGIDLGDDPTEILIDEKSYGRYFTTGIIRPNKWGGEGTGLNQVPEHLVPSAAGMSLGITAVKTAYMFHEPVHKHSFTEFFFFFGSNPMDMNEFDADVEFYFGEEREKHVISEPAVVVIPPGVYHCPLNYARVDKPIYCLEAFMTSKYEGTDLETAG